jgi:hypothetical protein
MANEVVVDTKQQVWIGTVNQGLFSYHLLNKHQRKKHLSQAKQFVPSSLTRKVIYGLAQILTYTLSVQLNKESLKFHFT